MFHRLEERVRAHVLICMLACYLTWHLRRAWAPLTFTDQDPPAQDNPVAPARRSAAAQAKASCQHDPAGQPLPQLPRPARAPGHADPQPGPLHRHPGHHRMLAEPTSTQRQAFELIGAPIPLTLK